MLCFVQDDGPWPYELRKAKLVLICGWKGLSVSLREAALGFFARSE